MRLEDQGESSNVEDRRGFGPVGVGGLGLGGLVIVIVAAFLGVDPSTLLNAVEQASPSQQAPAPAPAEGKAHDPQRQFVAKVLGSTEAVWTAVFRESGRDYPPPTLVLFTGSTPSSCGMGRAAMGPFYCPGDQKVYIDLAFYRDLQQRFHAPGDFAQAYVIAHEVGHHVQKLMGISDRMEGLRGRSTQEEYNRASVRLELQADCFAGVWAYHAGTRKQLEPGDVEEGLNAASAIGDDRLQRQAQGYVVPESFTHGSSEQRVRWFKRGMESGRAKDCDTFAARSL